MTKHTPGPWSLGTPNAKEYGEVGVHGPGEYGFIICDLQADGYDEKTQKANASLICAAPDLLKACEEALGNLVDEDGGYFSGDESLVKQLRAAIAKARGEA